MALQFLNDSVFTGKVGIGTTTPGAKLDVRSSATTAETIAQFGNGNIQGGLEIKTDGNLEWGFNTKNTRNFTFSTNQIERMRISSVGNVGIGTETPDGALEVDGGTTISSVADFITKSNTVFALANPATKFGIGYDASDNPILQGFNTNGAKDIGLQVYGGDVGIGTNSPDAKLDIKNIPTSGNGAILNIGLDTNSPTRAKIGVESFNGVFSLYNSGNIEDVKITTNGNSWFNGGNVGIGTNSPSTNLEINDPSTPKIRFGRASSYYWDIGHTSSNFQIESQTAGVVLDLNYAGAATFASSVSATDGFFDASLINTTDNSMLTSSGSADTALFKIQGSLGYIGFGDSGNYLEFSRNSTNYLYTSGANSSLSIGVADAEALRLNNDQSATFASSVTTTGELEVTGATDATLKINSTKNGVWSANEVLGKIDFFGNDTSGSGVGVKSSIEVVSKDTYGAAFNMVLKTSDGSTTNNVEALRLNYDQSATFASSVELGGDAKIARSAGGYTFLENAGGGLRASMKSNSLNQLIFSTANDIEALRLDHVNQSATFASSVSATNGLFSGNLEVNGNSITRSKTRGLGTNYATSEGWVASAGVSSAVGFFGGNFASNAGSAENKIEYDIGPFGSRELVWMSIPETASNDDGGWNKSMDGFNNSANNGFMSVIYVKRDSGTASGNFYHGCSRTSTLNLSGSANTNPYFSATSIANLPADVWCVSIGIIHAAGDTTTTGSNLGGIYRLDTGQKISTANTFRQKTSNAIQQQRVYHYYSTSPTAQLDFTNPGFYILDGSEPTLGKLLGSGSPSINDADIWFQFPGIAGTSSNRSDGWFSGKTVKYSEFQANFDNLTLNSGSTYKLILERFRKGQGATYGRTTIRKSGYKRGSSDSNGYSNPYTSRPMEIAITSLSQNFNFRPDLYYSASTQQGFPRPSGFSRHSSSRVSSRQYFAFRISKTTSGVTEVSNILAKLQLIGDKSNNNYKIIWKPYQ